jgi:ethanolamine utilization protein EutN
VILARVVGNIVATQKDPSHEGAKLLRVQPQTPEGKPAGDPLVVVDAFDAGLGDLVVVTVDGWSAGWTLQRKGAAVDAAVIGVVDRVDEKKKP